MQSKRIFSHHIHLLVPLISQILCSLPSDVMSSFLKLFLFYLPPHLFSSLFSPSNRSNEWSVITGIDLLTALIIACIASLVIICCTCVLCCFYMRLSSERKKDLERGYRMPLQIDTLHRNNSTYSSQHHISSPTRPTRHPTSRTPIPPAQHAEYMDWNTAF